MQISNEICMKFPDVLRDKLLRGEIELPDAAVLEYESILVYRVVARKKEDHRGIEPGDFKSYFELGKKPKTARGIKTDWSKDPHYYGVSAFLTREEAEQVMHFPNPNKKMAVGYVYQEGGPQETNERTRHVCWWLFQNADISGFKIEGEENE